MLEVAVSLRLTSRLLNKGLRSASLELVAAAAFIVIAGRPC